MAFEVLVLPQARRDFQNLHDWIAERSPEGASRWSDAFTDALRKLTYDPEGYGLAPETGSRADAIRQFFFKTRQGRTYRGLFTVAAGRVYVLHVRGPRQRVMRPDEIEGP